MSNIIPFPTPVAKARSWIRKLIQHGNAYDRAASRHKSATYMSARERFRREVARALGTRRTGWSHTCSGASGITVGFIGATACPYCGARALKPEPRA